MHKRRLAPTENEQPRTPLARLLCAWSLGVLVQATLLVGRGGEGLVVGKKEVERRLADRNKTCNGRNKGEVEANLSEVEIEIQHKNLPWG